MRLRLLLPRRRRRRSLRRLAAVAALALAGCGSSEPPPAPEPEPRGELVTGITEPNPAFLAGSADPAFDRWQLGELAPTYYRLVVEWDKNLAADGRTFDPAAPQNGCLRVLPPCAPWNGVRQQLAAVAAAQRAHPGRFQLMVVFMYTPEAYASPPSGCEKRDAVPRSRPPADLEAYRALIRTVQAEADAAGVGVPYWSPWNEPNHPYFISPQRVRCDGDAPSAAIPAYIGLARALQGELRDGEDLVLGELAATLRTGPQSTRMLEFVDGLPDDLVCAAPVFSVHKYRAEDPVDLLSGQLRQHGCEPRIWVTETGTKAHDCAAERADLIRWYEDPRVDAAFHYTLREDDLFATGLVTTDLSAALPSLGEWQEWGARGEPTDPPPTDAC